MTRILTRSEVAGLVTMADAVEAVEEAFGAMVRGESQMPSKVYLSMADLDGDFRAMPARRGEFASLKWVNAHPHNPERYGLPAVLASLILNDARKASTLAVMDATRITALRTGAAAAVATKHCLAGEVPASLGIVGAGVQGKLLIEAHRVIYPNITVVVADLDTARATALASEFGGRTGTLEAACACTVVCTATPARRPVVQLEHLGPDCRHINAMGADAPNKQEIAGAVLKSAWLIVDSREQATHSGEVNVPLHDGLLTAADIAGDIGQVVAGHLKRPPTARLSLFDSTGLAIQDLALAERALARAEANNIGLLVDLHA